MPTEGRAIAADYLKQGWRFAAARLRASSEGPARTPPVTFTFPSEQPVYPMRLTALAGSDLFLELFVIAPERAACPHLHLKWADSFKDPVAGGYGSEDTPVWCPEHLPWTNHQIGHPRALPLMWSDCVVTRLAGILAPAQMDEDLMLSLPPGGPYRWAVWTEEDRRRRVAMWACGVWALGITASFLIWFEKIQAKKGWSFALTRIASIMLLASAMTGGFVYAKTERVETQEVPLHREAEMRLFSALDQLASDRAAAGYSGTALGPWLRETLSEGVSLYDSHRLTYGDGPRQFEVIDAENRVLVRLYDEWGVPSDTDVTDIADWVHVDWGHQD